MMRRKLKGCPKKNQTHLNESSEAKSVKLWRRKVEKITDQVHFHQRTCELRGKDDGKFSFQIVASAVWTSSILIASLHDKYIVYVEVDGFWSVERVYSDSDEQRYA